MRVLPEASLDGLPHLLLHHVDVVVVQQQVSHTVLNQPAKEKNQDRLRPIVTKLFKLYKAKHMFKHWESNNKGKKVLLSVLKIRGVGSITSLFLMGGSNPARTYPNRARQILIYLT